MSDAVRGEGCPICGGQLRVDQVSRASLASSRPTRLLVRTEPELTCQACDLVVMGRYAPALPVALFEVESGEADDGQADGQGTQAATG